MTIPFDELLLYPGILEENALSRLRQLSIFHIFPLALKKIGFFSWSVYGRHTMVHGKQKCKETSAELWVKKDEHLEIQKSYLGPSARVPYV